MNRAQTRRLAYNTWEDRRYPATSINPPGGVGSPDRDTSDARLRFDAVATEVVYIAGVISHQWLADSEIRPHVHWQKTTSAAGAVYWRLRYKWWNPGTVEPAWSAYIPSTVLVSDADTADRAAIAGFGSISGKGKVTGSQLLFELTREGGNVADTYGADAKLHEFDFHYLKGQSGTDFEFSNQA